MPTTDQSRRDLHAQITDQLIAAIEADPGQPTLPWHRPGSSLALPVNALTNQAYQGINVISLWCAGLSAGFTSRRWATYRQWSAQGCQVRKGQKGSPVIFYRQYAIDPDPDDTNQDGQRRVARLSAVFNASQVEGYYDPDQDVPRASSTTSLPLEPIPGVESFIAGTGATIHYGGDQAYYHPILDRIQLPVRVSFIGTETASPIESFYGVLFHELGHWTGAPHRLNRVFGQRFGDDAYAAEELVAEIAAAFLSAELGVTPVPRPDHSQYLGHWLRLLRADKHALFTAAARASEAVRFLQTASREPQVIDPSATVERADQPSGPRLL